MIVVTIFGCIWGILQTTLGLIVYLFTAIYNRSFGYSPASGVFVFKKFFGSGVCLGELIILEGDPEQARHNTYQNSIRHEQGHRVQSRILGPLYLFIVGIPSLVRNIYGRLVLSKRMTILERQIWYYGSFPENWADSLGRVSREFKAR